MELRLLSQSNKHKPNYVLFCSNERIQLVISFDTFKKALDRMERYLKVDGSLHNITGKLVAYKKSGEVVLCP